jgi:PAS domain S-box-containing protein
MAYGTEGQAAASDRLFRMIFERTLDGMLVADVETMRLRLANPVMCRTLGYTHDEIRRLRVHDIHPRQDLGDVLGGFEKQVRREQSLARDVPVRRKDGSIFHADVNAFPIELAGRTYLIGLFRDVTQRRRVEEQLRESEGRFRSVTEQSSEGIILTDEHGSVIEWNRAQEEICGAKRSDVLGRPLWQVLFDFVPVDRRPAELAETLRAGIVEACRTGRASWFDKLHEHELVRADGARRCLQMVTYPIRARGGFRIGVACRDVTEKRRVESALRESEQKYRTLVETAGETIGVVDADGVFRFMNQTAAQCLGGATEDFIGKTMWDLFPKPIADRQAGSVRRVIESGEGMNVVVLTQLQGRQRWYNTTLEPMPNAAGDVTSVLIIGRDVHDLRQAQLQLEEYREKMSRAEQLASLGTLSATIAHELTQPLTVSRLALQNALAELAESDGPPVVAEALRESLDGIEDAASRVERFRNYARRSASGPPGPVHLAKVVARTIRLLEEKAKERNTALSVDGLDDLPAAHAREKGIEQVCFALIENAIQAASGRQRHTVTVTGRNEGTQIHLRFADDCGGVQPEILDRIFEPFFTTKGPGEGTGLGLCIVERVVSQARGKLWPENRPGHGVTFCVTLPVFSG